MLNIVRVHVKGQQIAYNLTAILSLIQKIYSIIIYVVAELRAHNKSYAMFLTNLIG